MNLFDYTQTIKRWINSSDKAEQLDLLVEITQRFVMDRFDGKVPPLELNQAIHELHLEIGTRRVIIAGGGITA